MKVNTPRLSMDVLCTGSMYRAAAGAVIEHEIRKTKPNFVLSNRSSLKLSMLVGTLSRNKAFIERCHRYWIR
jgi:cytidylate kinase